MPRPRERFAALSCALLVAATPALGQDAAPGAPEPSTLVAPVDVVATREPDADMSACESSVINDPIMRAWRSVMRDPDPFPASFHEGGAGPGASLAVSPPTRYRYTRLPRDPESNIMNTGLNPALSSRIAFTMASAMSELACVHVSMTLL